MDETKPIIFYLDDMPEGRRDLQMQLRGLFTSHFDVTEMPLEQEMEHYLRYLHSLPVAGVFIDQNLDETGEITGYTGVKLASYLRTIHPSLPIYLVTGHPIQGELESEEAGNAEAVIAKSDLITDSQPSLRFKKQFLRRVKQYEEALSADQLRFRELLLKKLNSTLTTEETTEYESLRKNRELPTDIAEGGAAEAVREQLGRIGQLLQQIEQIKESK